MDMIETFKAAGIIPVIVIEDESKAVPLAKALVKGGLPVLEVTFRTKAAAGAIAKIAAEVPEAIVGAGTLLTVEQVKAAKAAGAPMVKFFPAEAAGGVKMIKNFLGAFRFTGVKFMPTGGVNLANVSEYLSVPEIICCGGTWIVPKEAIASGDWDAIEKLASDAANIAKARS